MSRRIFLRTRLSCCFCCMIEPATLKPFLFTICVRETCKSRFVKPFPGVWRPLCYRKYFWMTNNHATNGHFTENVEPYFLCLTTVYFGNNKPERISPPARRKSHDNKRNDSKRRYMNSQHYSTRIEECMDEWLRLNLLNLAAAQSPVSHVMIIFKY